MRKKVVLAYSGGLDTSVCVRWLIEKGYDVIAVTADLGQGVDSELIKKRAKDSGAAKVYVLDVRKEFISDFVFPSLKANAVYEAKYLLSAALGRPLIAKKLVEIAKKEGADFIAHGCTGKGNDQVRFEVSISALAPNLKVIAPLRLWELKSREDEINYAEKYHIPIDVTKNKPYSLDKNLWGISIECGILEDPWIEPPQDAYQITRNPADAPNRDKYLEIYFEKGIPEKLGGKAYEPLKLIEIVDRIASEYGVGRSDLVENRLVGIKSREIYEAPAATIFHLAHRELENLVMDRELAHFKELITLKYSELIYYGLWYSPLRQTLDKFIDATQKKVTGTVKVKLYKGNCICVGRKSIYSLYKKELATYEKGDKFDRSAAEGFIKIWGLPYQK